MAVRRLFVEKKAEYDIGRKKLISTAKNVLDIQLADAREYIRYDIEGLSRGDYLKSRDVVFSEPPVDIIYEEKLPKLDGYKVFAVEYLPGQYDQRADSAAACVQLLLKKARPDVKCAVVYAVKGVNAKEIEKIKKYLINPVEAREASMKKPQSLKTELNAVPDVAVLDGFTAKNDSSVEKFHAETGFAMSAADLKFVRDYFRSEKREPTETELKVIDTYWSDHCRHTTFLTELKEITIESDIPEIRDAYGLYKDLFNKFNKDKKHKYPCLMDIATIGAKEVRANGGLDNLDESEEINACSVKADVDVDGRIEKWLVMFKNETHNHPTEIEPFGGAATCLGGAIRDPLSGRSYVYQSMRVTGAADPNASYAKTLKGKLPQRVISSTAAAGFSSYGNQIGLSTGIVSEVYHPNYVAKRLETGFVVGAAPEKNVRRERPEPGDKIILLGGDTGRDGCGGATGSSKAHTLESIDVCGAEVQKGNPLTERKLQRLFRDGKVTKLIKRCNDFGAGGVSVAIGELADSLDINLDLVPKKYEGLTGTETAISESQERMAVVVAKEDVDKFINYARKENLNAVVVASVTDTGRMRMYFRGKCVVDLHREMLNTNGVKQEASAHIAENAVKYFQTINKATKKAAQDGDFKQAVLNELSRLNVCSNKGMSEMFDSTVGAGTVFMPWGGDYQMTPSVAMAAKIPLMNGVTDTATVAAWGYNPDLMSESAFIGSVYSVLLSVIKTVIAGAPIDSIRLTLQEYFMRLKNDPKRWGQPAAALLGALYAQVKLNKGAIGGKDSMSGTFEDIDVVPTLISFALGIGKASKLITNVLKPVHKKIYRLSLMRNKSGMPDLDYAARLLGAVNKNIGNGNITFANIVEEGGAVIAIVKSALGNRTGVRISGKNLFNNYLGDIIISGDISGLSEFSPELIAEAEGSCIEIGGSQISFEEAKRAYTGTLENIYPLTAAADGAVKNLAYKDKSVIVKKSAVAKPKVLIPVFPGTNCEYDTAKRFMHAGAEPVIYVIRNQSAAEIVASAKDIAKLIGKSNMIAFPGGFSGGDEPDGSGKFIAATFSNPMIADAVNKLLYTGDGLILGICNGFQALIKLGLLPFGEIKPLTEDSATLTFNQITRHVSTISRIRVATAKTPWFNNVKVGDIYNVAVSHGEGKLICPPEVLTKLIENGQIATQYADNNGNATMESPYNPNGSVYGAEGLISPDGRILGKMGHSERIGGNLYKNVEGDYDMKLFESAVEYYK